MNSGTFISGLQLSEIYFNEDIKPILGKYFKNLKYSAGLIGYGSEVLGFDDIVSRDHHWGPRLIIFLGDTDYNNRKSLIDDILRNNLPPTCHGYATNFSKPDNFGVRLMEPNSGNEINHLIEIVTPKGYFNSLLGLDIYNTLSITDWLSFPQQILLSIQSGKIFHDQIGLSDVRNKLDYYPHDIWLYLMASLWQRIGQEEHLTARAGFTDQDIGSSIIASRLIRDIMQLGFLMERKFTPYAKWIEKAFLQLKCADELMPLLSNVFHSTDWKIRQQMLCEALEILANMHNNLKITKTVNSKCLEWHRRSFKAIHGEQIAQIIVKSIEDSNIRSIVRKSIIGGIDQISDNTDILENRTIRRMLIQSIFNL